ncbi:MAG: hypothetical protein JJU15_00895 [Pararhodobacter sp.]|nr:hypothetical protein [Pararhodobacter sp.]
MQKNGNHIETDNLDDASHSRLALHWYGFGSPVGLGILAISIGIAAVLLRVALIGFN